MSFLVAEIHRGRIRRETVRLFTDIKDAYQYYKKCGFATMWEITVDSNKPMKAIGGAELRKQFEQNQK